MIPAAALEKRAGCARLRLVTASTFARRRFSFPRRRLWPSRSLSVPEPAAGPCGLHLPEGCAAGGVLVRRPLGRADRRRRSRTVAFTCGRSR